MPTDELNDPVLYSWLVTVAGVLLMVAVVVYLVWAVRSTRARPEDQPPPLLPLTPGYGGDRYASVRPVYLARVDEVEHRFRTGDLDARGLHLELSAVVRDFATVRRGVDARVLTLSDLRRIGGAKRLASLIESYYRPAFARSGATEASPEHALDGARRVIRNW
ncbi:hypothetical protein [Actinotalea subterranea]|uniref:hypothetical protein n=1 Tax=Actinotalea subterranea TaxID=2607497 RepID=UPI0011EC81F8|nr:hypothetical protein [Actinotalea subterranea]